MGRSSAGEWRRAQSTTDLSVVDLPDDLKRLCKFSTHFRSSISRELSVRLNFLRIEQACFAVCLQCPHLSLERLGRDGDVELGLKRMDTSMCVNRGFPEPEAINVTSGSANRDPLGGDVILMRFTVVVRDHCVNVVGFHKVVNETRCLPVLGQVAHLEGTQYVIALSLSGL